MKNFLVIENRPFGKTEIMSFQSFDLAVSWCSWNGYRVLKEL